MIKSWSKFILEKVRYNPAKVAANINPDPMGFTSPAFEDIKFKYCSVYFPDGSEWSFDIEHEKINDTICPIKLKVNYQPSSSNVDLLQNSFCAQEYLNFYGTNLQFENHNEYRFNRLNLPNDEMFDIWFDGYIYDEEKYGFTEVKICLDQNNELSTNFYRTLHNGILPAYNADSGYILKLVSQISKNHRSWRKSFDDVLDDIYPPLSKFFVNVVENHKEVINIIPRNIYVCPREDGSFLVDDLAAFGTAKRFKETEDDIPFIGFLYLYYIKHEGQFRDDVIKNFKYIFTHWNNRVPIKKIVDVFDEIY